MQIDFKKLYDDIKVLEQNCPTIKLPISIDKNMFKEQVGKIASPKISTQLKIERQKFRDEIKDVGEKLPKIKVGIGVDAKGFHDEVKNVGSQLPTVKVPVTVDSKFFKDETARIQEILDTIKPVSIKVNADTQQFISTIKECVDELHKLKDITVTVKGKKPKEKPAAVTEDTPKKAKGKAKKEMDYDELLTMLKINQFSDGISQSKSTVGARLKSVRNLQSAAMQGGWQPSAEDLAWLANERNALERKNEAVRLNNTRPGTNLIDEYIRLREQESKAFREQLERQMNEEAKANHARLDANNAQLRENLKEWQKNNTAIAKAKEEARKRELAKEAQAAKEQKEYSDRTARLMAQETNRLQALKDKLAKLQNDITISQLSGKKIAMDSWLRKSDREAELINSIMSMGGTASAKYNGIAGFKEYVKPWNQQDKLKTDNKELKEALKTYERIEAILVRIRKTGIVPDNIDKLKQKELEARSIIQKSFGGALGSPAQQAAFNANYPQVLTQQNIDAAKSGAEISKRLKGEMRSAMSEFKRLIKEVRRDAINGTGRSEWYLANRNSRIIEILNNVFDKNTKMRMQQKYGDDIHRAYANPADINAKAIAEVEKRLAERWQKFDMLDNVTPKAYTNMYQYLVRAAEKIGSMGGMYNGRVLTKTPEEYKASYVRPSTGIDEAARKQQNLNAIQERYNAELEKQNALMTYGTLLSQKQIDTAIRKLEALRKKYEELGGERSKLQLSDIEAAGTTARDVNSAIVDRNVKAWSTDNVATVSQGLSHLSGMQQAQYNAWLQDPSKNNLKNLTLTTAEMRKLNREAQRYQRVVNDTNKTMESLNNKIHNHLSWMTSGLFIGTIFAIPAEVMNQWKELEYSLAGIRQVITEIEKNEGGNAFKEAFDLMEIAKKNGVGVEETMEAAKSIGRMYGKNPIDSNGVEEKGVGIRNTNLITSQAAKMAVADAFDMENAFKGLEAALSQWNLQTEDTNQLLINTNRILEAWTITAHAGAASAQDIGQAIEIAGTAAANAGVSFEFFNALVATGVRQTARSGNEIGQAIKSMMVSMQSNKSLKALKEWGIELYNVSEDGTKSMRSMEDIILDVSLLMNNTAKDTRGLLTTLSGGRPILASHSGNAV